MAAGSTFQHGSSVLTRNDRIGFVTSLFRPFDRDDDDSPREDTPLDDDDCGVGSFSVLVRSADELLLRFLCVLPSAAVPFTSSPIRLGVTGEVETYVPFV